MQNSAVDTIPGCAWSAAADGSIESTNAAWRAYLGVGTQGVGADMWLRALHPHDKRHFLDFWEKLLGSSEPAEVETRLRRHDGTFRWFFVRAVPQCDAAGRVLAWFGQNTDIEDRKRTEATLEGEKHLLERVAAGDALPVVLEALCSLVDRIADNCVCSVLLVDEARGVVRHAAAPGVPRALTEGIDGRSISEPHWGPCARAVFQNAQVIVADIAEDPGWRERDWSALCLQAGLRSCWTTPIRSRAGKPLGTFAIYQREPSGPTPLQLSLTARFTHVASIAVERAQSEAALNKMRAQLAHVARVSMLGALTASIAHEVSQPLSGVATNSRLIERIVSAQPIDTAEALAAAQRGRRDAERAVAVVERLRSLFQKAEGARERFALGACLHEVLDLLRHELQRSRVQVRLLLDVALPDVRGDRVQVQQVLVNLLLNAAEAMSEHTGPRLLGVSTHVAEGGSVQLTVSDTGPGIAASVLPHLFDAFYTTKARGLGIGLAVSRSIIESHEGQLWAEPRDTGAAFSFTLPCAP